MKHDETTKWKAVLFFDLTKYENKLKGVFHDLLILSESVKCWLLNFGPCLHVAFWLGPKHTAVWSTGQDWCKVYPWHSSPRANCFIIFHPLMLFDTSSQILGAPLGWQRLCEIQLLLAIPSGMSTRNEQSNCQVDSSSRSRSLIPLFPDDPGWKNNNPHLLCWKWLHMVKVE